MKNNVNLTREEQLRLLSGKDFWQSEAIGVVPAIRMSDGPHGLRYQGGEGDHLGINESAKATAFPTASASANTWDPELLRQMGAAIGTEARSLGVDIVLGPGVNIKRNPLAGRNFEYFSEDPLLAGTLAAAWINGLQEAGAGASLKHYAGNNQETDRLLSDSLIDPQALHELYLEAFRLAVTASQPETVMNAYNMVNGTYMSEHTYLLHTVLREQWGFEGAVVTDWGAMNDPVESLNAGTDLEMPGNEHFFLKTLEKGAVAPTALERATDRLVAIATKDRPAAPEDRDTLLKQHAELAQTIAEQGAVLLKNAHAVLPLSPTAPILVIGEMAAATRYQGAGSSHINPLHHVSLLEGLQAAEVDVTYQQGYQLSGQADEALQAAAVAAAQEAEQVVMVVGLPESAESEGLDRPDMRLPANQNALIEAVAAVNANVVVVLVAGAPVELPWREQIAGLLALYLNGQQVGTAAANLLLGGVNPSGRLAESYPIRYEDVPSSALFGQNPRSVPYAESLYVGYRYYDKARVPVAYPFGFGLSYTSFDYGSVHLDHTTIDETTDSVLVTLNVTNTGKQDGATVVQVYVGDQDQRRLTPLKALKGFQKVHVAAGDTALVTVKLPLQAFKHWDEEHQEFRLFSGTYQVSVATSSQDVLATVPVTATGQAPTPSTVPAWYQQPEGQPTVADFTALSGLAPKPVPVFAPGTLTPMNTPRELSQFSKVVAKVTAVMLKQKLDEAGNPPDSPEADFLRTIILDTPLIRLAQQSSGVLKLWHVKLLVGLANQPVRSLFRRNKA